MDSENHLAKLKISGESRSVTRLDASHPRGVAINEPNMIIKLVKAKGQVLHCLCLVVVLYPLKDFHEFSYLFL